jgi:hypothetical protein
MDPNRRQQIEELYHAAQARTPENRAAFLDGACGQDTRLRREVESLLEQSGDATATMSAGAASLGAPFGPYRIVSRLGAGGPRCGH